MDETLPWFVAPALHIMGHHGDGKVDGIVGTQCEDLIGISDPCLPEDLFP